MSDPPAEDHDNEIDKKRRRLLKTTAAGTIGYPLLTEYAVAERGDLRRLSGRTNLASVPSTKEGLVIEQDGSQPQRIEPITDAQPVSDYYGYEDDPEDSAATPGGLETENATVTFLYRNSDTDDLSLVVIHGDATAESGGQKGRAVLEFDGVNGAEWEVQDGPDGEPGQGDTDDYRGKSVGDELADGDTVGWGWDDNRTDGGAIGPLGESLDIEITHQYQGSRFGETVLRQGVDRWLFIDGSDPSNPIELADFVDDDVERDVSVTIRGRTYPDIDGVTVGQNSRYEVEIGETESGTWNWHFEDTPTLFREFFAIQNEDFPVVPSYDPAQIVESYPETIPPGGSATAVLEYDTKYEYDPDPFDEESEVRTTTFRLERTVINYADSPAFAIKYDFFEPEEADLGEMRLYQYCDYDIGGDVSGGADEPEYEDDVATFETDPEPFVYTKEDDSSLSVSPLHAGFSGKTFGFDRDPVAHHVGEWSEAPSAVLDGNLNNESEYPREGDDDPAVALEWEFGFAGAKDSETVITYFGAARSRDDLADLVARPQLSLSNPRLVQVVEDTRIERSDYREPDPDLVRDRNTTVLFDIGGKKLGVLDEEDTVTVEIERTYVVPPTLSDEPLPVTETDTLELSRGQLLAIEENGTDIREFFLEDDDARPPVFKLTRSEDDRVLKTVTISLAPSDPDVLGDSATLDRLDGDFSVTDMPPLRVGFIDLRDPDGGENYGDPETGKTTEYTETVSRGAESLSQYFPATDVRVYRHDTPIRGATDDAGDAIQGGKAIDIDAREAQCALENQTPVAESDTLSGFKGSIDEFDATVLIVPDGSPDTEDYFDFHDKRLAGVHAATKPRAAIAQEGNSRNYTPEVAGHVVTHEIGHHFKWKPYKDPEFDDKSDHPLAQRREPDDEDSDKDEVVNFPHADPDIDSERPIVTSVGYDLRDGSFALGYEYDTYDFDPRSVSFMSYYFGSSPKWADTRIYQDLLDGEFDPQPPEREGERQPILTCTFLLNDDGSMSEQGCSECVARPMVYVPDGSVLFSVRDGDDEEVGSRRTDVGVSFVQAASEFGSDGTTILDDVIPAALPFPDDAVAVEVTYDGTTTRIDPVSGLLRTAIGALPATAFVRNPSELRQAILNKLDAVERQMDDRAFRGAAQKLRNDVRSAVERWIAEDYPTGANVKSKGELLELVDDLADRAASAADGRGGNNDDRPPGNSGQTGTKGT